MPLNRLLLAGILSLILPMASCQKNPAGVSQPVKETMVEEKRLEGLVAAPDFPSHLEWLNTGSPLSLQNLRGKIVLLDFWTFCCINCMHVLPDLKKLEEKYPEELVVIGVHSAKFANERGTESIRQAILRYEVKHPVINDKDMEVWNSYGVHSWPTLVLINPDGRIIGMQSGEGIFNLFDQIIGEAAKYFEARGRLKRSPLNLALEEAGRPKTLLSFPGKIRVDASGSRLFITDSNHNRILITDLGGQVQEIIGSGIQGVRDGAFDKAEFHHPQGVYADGNILYVADTENHLIRKIDLEKKSVETLFGTGIQNHSHNFSGSGQKMALNSPWDLLVHEGVLYIAMAGAHQLYAADLKALEIKPYAGSGREARIDGALAEAALAQPSGIATDGRKLYFADSEVSSVRSADLDPAGKVETLIGQDLFEFGDIDGDSGKARLQHALGVDYHDGLLYVTDTYNSKIKVLDPVKKTSLTYAGTGRHGNRDGALNEAEFFEPAGLSVSGGKIYIADTNNHRVRVLDMKSGQVSTLEIRGLETFSAKPAVSSKSREVRLPEQALKSGDGHIRLLFRLPQGYKWTEDAPFFLSRNSENENILKFTGEEENLTAKDFSGPISVPLRSGPGKAMASFEAVVYYCRENSSLCVFDRMKIFVPVDVRDSGPEQATVEIDVRPQ